MPSTINPIRKALVKKSLLQGNSIRQALKDGGYAPGTQRGKNNGTTTPVVRVCQAEIIKDIQKKITVDTVLAGLCSIQALAIDNKDYSTATRCEELKGKWLAMFTDRTELAQAEKEANQFSLERLSRIKQTSTN